MEVLTLLIAVAALVIAVMAFQRTGGMQDLRRQMEDISTKRARETVADALDRLENLIRGQQQKRQADEQGEKESSSSPTPESSPGSPNPPSTREGGS